MQKRKQKQDRLRRSDQIRPDQTRPCQKQTRPGQSRAEAEQTMPGADHARPCQTMPDHARKQTLPDSGQIIPKPEQRARSTSLQINRPTPTLPPPEPRIIPTSLDFSPPSVLVFSAFAMVIVLLTLMTRILTAVLIMPSAVVIVLIRELRVGVGASVDLGVDIRTPVPLKHSTIPPSPSTNPIHSSPRLHHTSTSTSPPNITAKRSFEPSLPPDLFPLPRPPPPLLALLLSLRKQNRPNVTFYMTVQGMIQHEQSSPHQQGRAMPGVLRFMVFEPFEDDELEAMEEVVEREREVVEGGILCW
ncbi:hypothetical protein BDV97DRAFT_178163 [Delphinella strobiligena]|nr:hypothetical protein BDV97DRAFT_178163 [Delphinella strobiligena]